MALERAGIVPARGSVVVTGAAGGVGFGGDRAAGQARLHGRRVDRPAGRSRLPQRTRRRRDHRAQGIDRRAACARQGALGRRHRRGRLDDARQRAVDDALWGRRCGLRTCRGHGSADHGRAVHPARSFAYRHRFGHVPAGVAAGSMAASGDRSRPRQDRCNDQRNQPRRCDCAPAPASLPAKCAAALW